jgi:hypothetical protein
MGQEKGKLRGVLCRKGQAQRVDTGQEKGKLRGVLCRKGQAHQMHACKKKMKEIGKRSTRRGGQREAKIGDKKGRRGQRLGNWREGEHGIGH